MALDWKIYTAVYGYWWKNIFEKDSTNTYQGNHWITNFHASIVTKLMYLLFHGNIICSQTKLRLPTIIDFSERVVLSLRSYPNIKFVQEAENGEELLAGGSRISARCNSDDLRMPRKKDGITANYQNHQQTIPEYSCTGAHHVWRWTFCYPFDGKRSKRLFAEKFDPAEIKKQFLKYTRISQ